MNTITVRLPCPPCGRKHGRLAGPGKAGHGCNLFGSGDMQHGAHLLVTEAASCEVFVLPGDCIFDRCRSHGMRRSLRHPDRTFCHQPFEFDHLAGGIAGRPVLRLLLQKDKLR
ncbi:hypothetical protein D3C71_1049200 [compost metagenome]